MTLKDDAAGDIPVTAMVKEVDAWWTVLLVDPVATRLTRVLANRSAVTPTQITVVAHLLGIVAVALYASGELVAAAAVFEIRFVADCLDGKLARVTGQSSRLGQALDVHGDRVVIIFCIIALGWSYSPGATVTLTAAYLLHFEFLGARQRLAEERRSDGTTGTEPEVPRWKAALARRRLYPTVASVDIEHLLLFVAPLVAALGFAVLEPILWTAAAFFVAQTLRYAVSVLRLATALDRADQPSPPVGGFMTEDGADA